MRFGSVLCLPVWSFDGPSRQDGVLCWFAMRTYWLVTVSGFQGSSCGGFPAYPAVLPAAHHPLAFGGKEIHYALTLVLSTGFPEFFRVSAMRPRQVPPRRTKTPPELDREASKWRRIVLPTSGFLWFRLPIRACFQHTLQCLKRRPAVRCCTVPAAARGCNCPALPLVYTHGEVDLCSGALVLVPQDADGAPRSVG